MAIHCSIFIQLSLLHPFRIQPPVILPGRGLSAQFTFGYGGGLAGDESLFLFGTHSPRPPKTEAEYDVFRFPASGATPERVYSTEEQGLLWMKAPSILTGP